MKLSQNAVNFANKILKHNQRAKQKQPCCSHEKNHEHLNENKSINNIARDFNLNQNKKEENNCQIKPYLHAHDHRKERQIYQKSTQQKLANMRTFKQEGNDHYKNQRFKEASYFYQKMIVYSDYTFPQTKKDEQELSILVQQANCNLGISLIKLEQWNKSQSYFIQAKKGKDKKITKKSIYWICKLYVKKNQIQKAEEQLNALKKLNENEKSQQIDELQKLLKNQKRSKNNQDKKLCQNMFKKQTNSQKSA